MAKKKASRSTASSASSWWKERGKIMASASKTVAKAKPKAKKKAKAKKAAKAVRGAAYVCDVCGCEVVCVSDSAGNVVCCEEPMSLIC